MNDHHLILGRLEDFITGRILDDTHDERYRQKVARLLVETKGYTRSDIRSEETVLVKTGTKSAKVPVTFIIYMDNRAAMLIQYGPGSLVTRYRPALALAKIAAPCQIPVVVVTNGENADILDSVTGRVTASGFDHIPSKAQLAQRLHHHAWSTVSKQHAQMASRIVMAFEVDDRCPCDDTVCRWDDISS
jgi:hypothetical protein